MQQMSGWQLCTIIAAALLAQAVGSAGFRVKSAAWFTFVVFCQQVQWVRPCVLGSDWTRKIFSGQGQSGCGHILVEYLCYKVALGRRQFPRQLRGVPQADATM